MHVGRCRFEGPGAPYGNNPGASAVVCVPFAHQGASMNTRHALVPFLAIAAIALQAGAQAREQKFGPLTLERQGSFFVGGEVKSAPPSAAAGPGAAPGEITVNQMYVQFQIPPRADRHAPVVMVHGCCLSSKTWETTPDGRMGWNEYFVRKGRPVYLADQVSRARSGFDPSVISAVKSGTQPPSALPNIIAASHQVAWTVFRFGPSYPKPFDDEQFPVEAAAELYKQMIPDLNALLPNPNPTWTNMAALGKQLKGAVLMGHSESGFFPQQAALIDPSGIRAMISIEQPCPELTQAQVTALARIPTLVMFGDHLSDVPPGIVNWKTTYEGCNAYVEKVKAAGGDITMMYLPAMGIKGNSHMLMQDKNNLQLADLILGWLDTHVDKKK
jgi:pimeloyl-ACP methyl ester carboxylesterase